MGKIMKKLHKHILIVLFAILVLSGAMFGVTKINIQAQPVWEQCLLKEEYRYGEIVSIPERTLSLDENTVTATSVVTFPNGLSTSSKNVTLNQNGVYKVVYSAYINGKPYTETEYFTVKYLTVNVGSGKTQTKYGTHALAPNQEGLVVRLAEGDKLSFEQIIDVNGVNASDELITFFATADTQGTYDFKKLYLQLTDATDSSNYIKMRLIAYEGEEDGNVPSSYILAGGNGQPMEGWEATRSRLHIENNYGTPVRHSFRSLYGDVDQSSDKAQVENNKITISYDSNSKSIYINGKFVIDLDNQKYFSDLWTGFVSNKVKLSIWADSYSSSTANFVITKIKGVDLANEFMPENEGPQIYVDTEYTKMPNAKVGTAYKIPVATAYDDYSGESQVKVSVWYNLTSEQSAYMVNVQNGCFVPERTGVYAILYEAQDSLGNKSQKVLWLRANVEVPVPVVELSSEKVVEAKTGDWVEIATPNVTSSSGNATLKTAVTYDGVTEEITTGFRPEKAGTYTVSYTATDYIGSVGVNSYTVNVTTANGPIFVDKPFMPRYLIAGSEYTLPVVYANDYSSGVLVKKLAQVKVTDVQNPSGKILSKEQKYTPSVLTNFEKIKIEYVVDNEVLKYEIPTVLSWTQSGTRPELHYENYFDNNGVTMAETSTGMTVTATAEKGNFTFANILVAQNFQTSITAIPSASKFEGIKVRLFDVTDNQVSITATLKKNGNGIYFITSDTTLELENGFGAKNKFKIGFANGSFKIGDSYVSVSKTENGKNFEGFPSGRIYLQVEFIDAKIGAQYTLNDIDDHTMGSATTDRVAPKVATLGVSGGSVDIGTKVTLPAAMSGDAVDPNVIFHLTVTDPLGEVVVDENGVLLKEVDPTKEYVINCNKYGQYKVKYYVSDTFNVRKNDEERQYSINVEDCEAPIIDFRYNFDTKAKVGDVIVIPEFSVTDNFSQVEKIIVKKYVLNPTGYLICLPDVSNSIKTQFVGVYEFRIVATDEAGNTSIYRHQITVTE